MGAMMPLGGESKMTAQEVLGAMVAAYKGARSYADQGVLVMRGQSGDQPREDRGNYQMALVRPNKLRMQIDNGIVICDGEKLSATAASIPGQILRHPAPEVITVESIYSDHFLAGAMMRMPAQTFSWLPLQALLLLADDPLKTLLYENEELSLLDAENFDERPCYRVQIFGPRGRGVFWIDQETYVLRRFDFPIQPVQALVGDGQVQGLTLTAAFQRAQLNVELDPKAFQFEVPADVKYVENLAPAGFHLLGQPVGEFQFVDPQGDPVTRESLNGKVGVIDIWATQYPPCRPVLQEVARTYRDFKENERVVFMAASIDEPNITNDTLREVLADWQAELPIVRDPTKQAFTTFGVTGVPTTILIGSDGRVQVYQQGGDPGMAAELTRAIESLLAGRDIFPQAVALYKQGMDRFLQVRDGCIADNLYVMPAGGPNQVPRAEILERTEPKSLAMTSLWKSTEWIGAGQVPGNLLVVPDDAGRPRLLVLKTQLQPEVKSFIVELGLDGRVAATHSIETDPNEPIFFLRTGVGADGRRSFAASSLGLPHVYLLDDQFKPLVKYPAEAVSTQHAGIADVRLADLDGDGNLEMVVGYLDVVGVQGVTLGGERIWAERSLVNVLRVSPLDADTQGRRGLLCMNVQPDASTLVVLDGEGKRQREIVVPNRAIGWIAAGDLNGDGRQEFCALDQSITGDVTFIGLDLEGRELWNHPVPRGVHRQQIEAVTSGRLLPDTGGQWLVAAADSTILVLDGQGQLLDEFAYGAELTGLAAAEWDGKQILLVATTEGVEAWQVGPKGQ
jgi:outer membrane lipoprotein-sorting protein